MTAPRRPFTSEIESEDFRLIATCLGGRVRNLEGPRELPAVLAIIDAADHLDIARAGGQWLFVSRLR